MPFAAVYPACLNKVERTGRPRVELAPGIAWRLGCDDAGLQAALAAQTSGQALFEQAPALSPTRESVTGGVWRSGGGGGRPADAADAPTGRRAIAAQRGAALLRPGALAKALVPDGQWREAIQARMPGRQRIDVLNIAAAKEPETRVARVGFRERILAGKGAQAR